MSSAPSGGLSLTTQMRDILSQPGYLSAAKGGQTLRELYRKETVNLDPSKLSDFGICCFCGIIEHVKKAVEAHTAPDLEGTETPFKFGYATLVVAGAQRVVADSSPPGSMKHLEVLKYLISRGMPPDPEDITGLTALHHATCCPVPKVDLARVLLESGANVNHQNRYGEVALVGAFQLNLVPAIDLLMEFGAELTIADADNVTPMSIFLRCGPQVTATVKQWIRKRSGEKAPRDEKRCDGCGRDDVVLKNCAKCQVARYCAVECQRKHWKTHKKTCQPFTAFNTVVLRPFYEAFGSTIPTANLIRDAMGYPTSPIPGSHKRAAHTPKSLPSESKNLIIKVQVPFDFASKGPAVGNGDLFLYTKKRDFVCAIRRVDNPAGYDRISQVVRTKGVGGAKAYFAAELKSKDELIVKVSEVLAEQPF